MRSRNCLQLRATFYRQLEECRDGEKVEEFAVTVREYLSAPAV